MNKLDIQDEMKANIDYLKDELGRSQGYIAHFVECHAELREKVENINENLKNISSETKLSSNIEKILDTVETTEGYSELLVKDFEGIHLEMQEFNKKMEILGEKLDNRKENVKNLNAPIVKISTLDVEFQSKTEKTSEISAKFLESADRRDLNLKKENNEMEDFKKKIANIITTLTSSIATEQILHCRDCNTILSKDLPLREDGVTVQCPQCKKTYVVGTLKEGFKWMHSYCKGSHFTQFPVDKKVTRFGEKCQACGEKEYLSGSVSLCIPLRLDYNYVMREIENTLRKMETTISLSSDAVLECCHCGSNLPKHLPLRDDGVSVKCCSCDWTTNKNIVGKLKDNMKWMVAHSDSGEHGHYQQFPRKTKNRTEAECQICGRTSSMNDASQAIVKLAKYR